MIIIRYLKIYLDQWIKYRPWPFNIMSNRFRPWELIDLQHVETSTARRSSVPLISHNWSVAHPVRVCNPSGKKIRDSKTFKGIQRLFKDFFESLWMSNCTVCIVFNERLYILYTKCSIFLYKLYILYRTLKRSQRLKDFDPTLI